MSKRSPLWVFICFTFFLYQILGYDASEQATLEGKIIGGTYALISKFPHAAFLKIKCGNTKTMCGASVINQHLLATAAHCLYCHHQLTIDVYAGHENLYEVTVVRTVSGYALHASYSDDTLENDIALVHLTRALPLDRYIKRVIIKDHCPVALTGFVSGWGVIDDITMQRTRILKTVQQSLCPRNICALVGSLHRGMICAGDPKRVDNRPTKGDSGSGLVTQAHELIGIVSFRTDAYPGLVVYTNVSYYLDWIKQTAKKLTCKKIFRKIAI